MSSTNDNSSSNSNTLRQDLLETTQKVEASLQQAIQDHISSPEFSPSQGLDFLDVKNSLLLSYLIELTYDLRNRLLVGNGRGGRRRGDASLDRLIVMKTVLDKMRGLDKKLRYQIDKLLAAGTTSSTFATASDPQQQEDPLQFRPDAAAMEQSTNDDDSSSSSDDDGVDGDEGKQGEDDDEDDLDDDLKVARLTVAMAREKRSHKSTKDEDEEEGDSNVYRAPRLAAVPYTQDKEDKQAQREKRRLGHMRASELAQTLRSQYGDQPEQEDIRGGSDFGRQREAARRMAEREAEKTRFEEDTMVRLTTTRKERKERQRLMRDESSNLGAIANLDNLIRDTHNYGRGDTRRNSGGNDEREDRKRAALAMTDDSMLDDGTDRYDNGKRKRQTFDADGKAIQKKGRKSLEAKNSLQAALFGGGQAGGGKQSKKKKKRNSY